MDHSLARGKRVSNFSMAALEWKYDNAHDSWILEPSNASRIRSFETPTPRHRHSSSETFCSPIPAQDGYSSASPLWSLLHRRSMPSPLCLSDAERHGEGRFWKSWKRYWTCFTPPIDHHDHDHHDHDRYHHHTMRPSKKEKQKILKPRKAMANTRNSQAQFHASTNNANNTYYASMNAEEREENLKAVVLYCKGASTERWFNSLPFSWFFHNSFFFFFWIFVFFFYFYFRSWRIYEALIWVKSCSLVDICLIRFSL